MAKEPINTPSEKALPTPIDIRINITGHGVDDDFNPVPVDKTFNANTTAIVYTFSGDTRNAGFALLGGISGSILYDLLKQFHKVAPEAFREALAIHLLSSTLRPDHNDKSNEEE